MLKRERQQLNGFISCLFVGWLVCLQKVAGFYFLFFLSHNLIISISSENQLFDKNWSHMSGVYWQIQNRRLNVVISRTFRLKFCLSLQILVNTFTLSLTCQGRNKA